MCAYGCFGAQRDAINNDANAKIHNLDLQCKENMTDWCVVQYQIVENNRQNQLNDVSIRQQNTAEAVSHSGDGFSNLGHR